jgi:hypothetical protein
MQSVLCSMKCASRDFRDQSQVLRLCLDRRFSLRGALLVAFVMRWMSCSLDGLELHHVISVEGDKEPRGQERHTVARADQHNRYLSSGRWLSILA